MTTGVAQGSVIGPILFLLYAESIRFTILQDGIYKIDDGTEILYKEKI